MSALPVCDPAPIRAAAIPDSWHGSSGRRGADLRVDRDAGARGVDPRQGVLALVREVAPADPRPRRRTVPDDFGPVPTSTAELPSARDWAAWLTPALLQVACGARPAPQIMRHVSRDVYDSLVRRHSRAVRTRIAARRPVRIRAVLVSHPVDGVAEVSVVVDDAARTRALALRCEGLDGRWTVTALEIGG
ncbi:Rv3235 family protein [Agilicoccus flavus]|uniref:Rv3235 family protein n=1 Tax=Agilicoccus flavus TaxID=2775968 RepID=UPI001CF6E09D|nr:Rv3235 family protein [Agilicoccus flavus]